MPARTYQELSSHQHEDAAASAGLGIKGGNLVLHLLEREALQRMSEHVAISWAGTLATYRKLLDDSATTQAGRGLEGQHGVLSLQRRLR